MIKESKPSKKATAPAPTKSNRANARSGIFAGRKKSSKKSSKRQPTFYGRQDSSLRRRPGGAGDDDPGTVERSAESGTPPAAWVMARPSKSPPSKVNTWPSSTATPRSTARLRQSRIWSATSRFRRHRRRLHPANCSMFSPVESGHWTLPRF